MRTRAWVFLWAAVVAACTPQEPETKGRNGSQDDEPHGAGGAGPGGADPGAGAGTASGGGTGGPSTSTGDGAGGTGGSEAGGSGSGASGAGSGSGGSGGGSGGGGPAGAPLNPGWIGGACASAGDCDNPSAVCEQNGFPSGMCTQACALSPKGTYVCPDADVSPGTLYTTSRCIEAASGEPACVAECDFDKSPTGCRPGYTCVLRQRAESPGEIFPVCLPSASQGWPGEPKPAFDIGAPCSGPSDCEHLACLDLPNGYCVKTMCDVAGCPAGSSCFSFDGSELIACLRDCDTASDCRTDEGYTCDADASVCWTDPDGPGWDASVGPADCASAWASGLSPCDMVPDDYVVVRKSARNMALCKKGAHVASFNVGLGFAPAGDKEWEGDGKTPEGVFYTAQLIPSSDYYKAFLISYPDAEDADRGIDAGEITQADKNAIVSAQASCKIPPQTTALGGYVEIHGMGGGQDWTWGCVAIDNTEIDQLWAAMGPGDSIVILP